MSRATAIEERMIRDLLRRKRAYEGYFKDLKGVDNPAQSAYLSLIKAIVELAGKTAAPEAADAEECRRVAERILRDEYGVEL